MDQDDKTTSHTFKAVGTTSSTTSSGNGGGSKLNLATGTHRTITFSKKALPGMIQFGAARFKSQPDLHKDTNIQDESSQIWRSSQGQQRSDELWSAFRSRLDSTEEATNTLKKFVAHYNPCYDQWSKDLQPDSHDMKLVAIKIKATPQIDLPSLQFVATQLCTFVLNLSVALTDDNVAIPEGLYLIVLINILSRAPHNLQIILQENALTHPFQAARLATLKLSSFKDPLAPVFVKWWPYLKVLLGNFCQIVSNIAHDRIGWQMSVRQSANALVGGDSPVFTPGIGEDMSPTSSSPLSSFTTLPYRSSDMSFSPVTSAASLPTSPIMIGLKDSMNLSHSTGSMINLNSSINPHSLVPALPFSTQQLLKLGVVGILIDSLQFFNDNFTAKRPKDSSQTFRYLIADTLGVLIFSNGNSMHCKLKENGSEMKTIIGAIGRKPYTLPNKKHSALQAEFLFQLHMLRVIRELTHNNIQNAKQFINLNGFKTIKDVIQWTTECFQPESFHYTDDICQQQNLLGMDASDATSMSASSSASSFSDIFSNCQCNAYDNLNTVLSSLKYTTFSVGTSVKPPTVLKRSRVNQLTQLFGIIHSLSFTAIPISKIAISKGSSGSFFAANNNNNGGSGVGGITGHSPSGAGSHSSTMLSSSMIIDQSESSSANNNNPNTNTNNNYNYSSSTSNMGTSNSTSWSNYSSLHSSTTSIHSGVSTSNPLSNSGNNSFLMSSMSGHQNNNNNNMSNSLNNNMNNNNGEERKFVNTYIIEMVLENLFKEKTSKKSTRALDLIRTRYPELQLIVLEYLTKIIMESGEMLDILRKHFMWRLIMKSPFFYQCLFDERIEGAESMDAAQTSRAQYMFKGVRSNTLSFVRFVATHNNIENTEEVMMLLHYMKENLNNPTRLLEITHLLVIITKSNPSTVKALIAQKIFSQLADIIQLLLQQGDTEDKAAKRARNAIFSFLGQLVIHEELSLYALTDKYLIETMFQMLRRPELKTYALTQIIHLMKLNPEPITALDEIFNVYIGHMAKIKEDASPDGGFEITLALLDGIRQVIKANPKKQQLFKEFGVFIKIVTLVNIDVSSATKERMSALCHSVIKTVIVLMANSPKIKKHVRRRIGYDSLKNIIVKYETVISETTMKLIFDMIVDDEFDREYNYVIQNSDAILLLFSLLRNFPLALQHRILDTITPIVLKCTTNQSVCCNSNLIYHLLDAINASSEMDIITKILGLIESLGYHSVNVRELKKMFRLLKSGDTGDNRPPITSVLLSTLQNIAITRNPGPQVYFDFDGRVSSINLPTLDKWPFAKGFTCTTWVRIESFVDPTGTPDYKPRLFSFLNDSGSGIEALFIYHQLQIQTVHNYTPSKPVLTTGAPSFDEHKWYFVSIVYSTNLFSASEIKVYIDGALRTKTSLKMNTMSGVMNNFKIGNSIELESRTNPLYGQIGAFNIFEESLSPSQIQSIFSLGANFNTSFTDVEGSGGGKSSHATDQSLTNRLFLSYNCRAIDGDICLDNTPNIGVDRNCDAALVSINPCISRDIKDIIYCLGGIKVLFPLIPQANQSSLGGSSLSSSSVIDPSNNARLTMQILALFKDMLRGSEANQEEMLRCKGLSVLSYLLQQIPSDNLTQYVLNIFKDMRNQITDPNLVEEVYSILLLDFRLWIKTRYEVQRSLLLTIKQIVQDKLDQVRDIITVQVLLDIMANFFWYEFHETSSILNAKDIIQKRPSINNILSLRQITLEIIQILLKNPTTNDVSSLCRYAIYTLDSRASIEALEFIMELIAKPGAAGQYQAFFDELEKLGSTDIFLTLLSRKEERVRIMALQLIAKIYVTHYQHTSSSASKLTIKRRTKSIFQDSIIIARSLHLFPLTELTYGNLLAFALGICEVGSTFHMLRLENMMAEASCDIVFPEVMSVIIKLLPSADTIVLRQMILHNIKMLLVQPNNSANRTAFLQIDKWPEHLFSVLNDTEIKNDAQYSNVTDLIIDIMKVLAIHSMNEVKGFKILEQILATLRPYAERGVLNYHFLTRTLLSNIVVAVKSEAMRDKDSPLNNKSKKLSDNIIHFLMVVEEFVFYSPLDDVNSLSNSLVLVDSAASIPEPSGNGHQSVNLRASLASSISFLTVNDNNNNNNGGSPGSSPSGGSGTPVINAPSHFSRIHLNERNEWIDYQLVTEVLDMVDTLKIGNYTAYEGTYSNSLQTGKAIQVYTTHQQRIVHRILLETIKEACKRTGEPISVVHLHISRLRTLMDRDLHSKSEEVNIRCLYALSQLIKAMRNTIDNNLTAYQKLLVPPMKDIIRKVRSGITAHLVHRHTNTSRHSVSVSDIEHEIAGWVSELSDSTRSDDFCTIVMCHVRWTHVCEYVEEHSAQFYHEEKAISHRVDKRKKKRQKNLQAMDDKEADTFSNTEKKADADIKHVDRTLWIPERDRRLALLTNMQMSTYEIAAQWRRIMRELCNERGPWGTTETVVHWKHDKTENNSRMRYKQKRNYKFNDHANCAIDEDVNSPGSLASIISSDSSRKDSSISDLKVKPLLNNKDNDLLDDWALVEESDMLLDDQASPPFSPGGPLPNFAGAASMPAAKKILYTTQCDYVTPMNVKKGRLDITSVHITFTEELTDEAAAASAAQLGAPRMPKIKTWACEEIKDVHLRRYLLRGSALEVFMRDQTTFFLNFSKNDRNKVFSKIHSVRRTYYKESMANSLSPQDTLKKAMADWQQRRMSNFDYLMTLNTLAGRTYNDLTQYPVLPWVLADYTSTTLDLSNPGVYRDLSKPVGALDPDRLKVFRERYDTFDDPVIPKFYYGSHYSSAGIVLFYMIRMEPFTSHFLQLQGGRFDHADRMFDSIAQAYRNTLSSTTDVKELIPEFFYLPEMFTNQNNFSFGVKQDGRAIGDVILPPWAATPHDFVRINREALESEFVSAHLHEWIDLIFGIKQRGRLAVEAFNVFYYLTYEGAVDIDAIEDEMMRKATESQINHFGQTPTQLFAKKAHPSRDAFQESQQSIFKSPQYLQAFYLKIGSKPLVYVFIPEQAQPMSYILSDKVSIVDRSRVVTCHKWFPNTQNERSPFTLELDPSSNSNKRRVGLPFANDVNISQNCFAVTNDGRFVISCGHWDNSFKISFTDSAKLIQSVVKHKDIVTCLAWSSEIQTLITGSRDTTLMVWNLRKSGATPKFDSVPTHILYGHDDEITCVDLNVELDICVSGSKDGSCIIHSLRKGEYVRTIYLPTQSSVSICCISNQGHIVIYSQDDLIIYLYSINGHLLSTVNTHERLQSIIISKDSEYLISGGEKGTLVVRTLYNLKFAHKLTLDTQITSLASDQRHLMVGMEDGRLLIVASSLSHNASSSLTSPLASSARQK
ncbi:hypothetical protein SAMD00019534_003950 [Acytostelium subglobosum LB1]|uniref:hypothetical protein n=1 Tax=Acytostelium subglobosum LB1 TaxID=1410327 RepID=UPI000644CBFB|nr:hypothetical protein SAMD00019534_003950 [Acytostelium subglobosum LB1]GAM17220.1 hypothetical protein SAMD00019534_003950 [Acytostelium subglobosum LB1]|eukprot:XP_012759282.1 hypothetical protein SAMD00019534_003950 [Acytostelium subglobosum LB1]